MIAQPTQRKPFFNNFFHNPARVIVTSFAVLIIIGTFLLMLPISAKSGEWMPLSSALFTATSATCVTGLIVVDTYTYFSIFGQLVILLLIQLGGLGLVTFATFFNVAIRKRVALKTLHVAQESTSSDSIDNIRQLLKLIFTFTFAIEFIGACFLSIVFVGDFGFQGIYISVFLAISAFCNAGFDILGFQGQFSSLTHYFDNPIVLITIMLLIICGGLGFIVWQDLIHYNRNKHLLLHSKIVLVGTASLLITGAILFAVFEWNNPKTMGGMNTWEKLLNSAFLSVTTRTAGFNSTDVASMCGPSKLVSILFMFVGTSPGGTGGGIKITTIFVLVMTVVSVFRGHEETVIGKHRVDKNAVYKALAVTFAAFIVVLTAACFIFFTTHADGGRFNEVDALFEATSAFGTVGLSVGVSQNANLLSQILLTLTMFIGRVGPASLAISLAMHTQYKNKVMPEAKIMVG